MLISIVMPVYNAERFINRAIESIIHQSFSSWELILVDDGSKDKSGYYIDVWQIKDNRIHAVHQQNKGASAARNLGIKYCKGEYIYFIDADDYLEDGLLLEISQAIDEKAPDVVLVNSKRIFKEGHFNDPDILVTDALSQGQIKRLLLCGFLREPFTKVCKRCLIEGKQYQEQLRSANDLAFVPDIMEGANSFACTQHHFYFYNKMNDNSITNTKSERQKYLCDFHAWHRFLDFCKKYHWENIDSRLPDFYVSQCIYYGLSLILLNDKMTTNQQDMFSVYEYIKSYGLDLSMDISDLVYLRYFYASKASRLGWVICNTDIGVWENRAIKSFSSFYSISKALNRTNDIAEASKEIQLLCDKFHTIQKLPLGQALTYWAAIKEFNLPMRIKGKRILNRRK